MKIIKLILAITSLSSLTSCEDEVNKKLIYSWDKVNAITILTMESNHYFVNGDYQFKTIPTNRYIVNKSSLEYFTGLVKWTSSGVEIYQTYGQFDESRSEGEMKYFKVSTKEFETLRRDSLNYVYFYY